MKIELQGAGIRDQLKPKGKNLMINRLDDGLLGFGFYLTPDS